MPEWPSERWLGSVTEEIVDPGQRIIDPHHHLWPAGGALPYGPAELEADVDSGHDIVATMYMECRAGYRADGPAHLLPVGETEFVVQASQQTSRPLIAGIIARADLRLDSTPGGLLDEVIDAHEQAGAGLFRGIRQPGAWDPHPEEFAIAGRAPEHLYEDPAFRAGVRRLGERGLTYDTWHYHHQNPAYLELARAVPETTFVLDHFGTPLGVGRFADKRDEIFDQWRLDVAEIAGCPNVVAKLGGLAMPDNGFPWVGAERPPTSDEVLALQGRYYEHMIECFGPERCMFESNFPIDRYSLSYAVFWNACKKLVAGYSPDERDALFFGTAARVYRLPLG